MSASPLPLPLPLLLILSLLAVSVVALDPTPPKWPSKYTVKGRFFLPLAAPGPVVEPVISMVDTAKGWVSFDYYDGLDKTVFKYDANQAWMIDPRVDKFVCYYGRAGARPAVLPSVLPDLTGWEYDGERSHNGIATYQFKTSIVSPAPSNFTSKYQFQINKQTGHPVYIEMEGYNIIWGAHPDIYAFEYESFKPNQVDETAFALPSMCHNSEARELNDRQVYRAKLRLGRVNALHPVFSEDPYDHFARHHNKVHGEDEVAMRRELFEATSKFIANHNANKANPTQLKINHFADLTNEERKALYGNFAKRTADDGATATHVVDPTVTLPDTIDWRDRGAVQHVKDQGVCGSCWTFGSAASLEGAYFVKYGTLPSLSEQQIMDCAYIMGDMGCDGGTAYAAYTWLMGTQGLDSEENYPYKMQDDFCNASANGIKITGYVNVTMGSEEALKSAVATMPVTVAINTDDPVWYYHTGDGVYYGSDCPGGLDDLDHQVTVVGYGTQDGADYWLVKNSYSHFWGNKGYIKMARNRGNNCGIATQPNYPIVA